MLASIALIAAVSTVDFKGGDTYALAQAIAKESGASVLISVFQPTRIPGCTFDTKDADTMADVLKKSAGFWMSPGSDPIFHPGTLPPHLVQLAGINANKPYGFSLIAPPPEALKDGKLNWETKAGEAFRVGDFVGMTLSKGVDLHWMFQDVQLVVVSKGLSEVEFLTRCAKAVGAKLLTSKSLYRLELDPAELRVRAKRSLDKALTGDRAKFMSASDRSGIELAKAAVASASNQNILQAFANQGSETRIPVGPGNVDAVFSRMQAAGQSPQDLSEDRGRGGRRGMIDPAMISRLDPRTTPTWLVLRSNFQTSVEMMLPGPGGRGGRTIRF